MSFELKKKYVAMVAVDMDKPLAMKLLSSGEENIQKIKKCIEVIEKESGKNIEEMNWDEIQKFIYPIVRQFDFEM